MSIFSAMMVTSIAVSVLSFYSDDFGFNIFSFMFLAIAFLDRRFANGS